MNINLTVRFKNPWFWVSLFGVILTAMGVSPEMFTSWETVANAFIELVRNPYKFPAAAHEPNPATHWRGHGRRRGGSCSGGADGVLRREKTRNRYTPRRSRRNAMPRRFARTPPRTVRMSHVCVWMARSMAATRATSGGCPFPVKTAASSLSRRFQISWRPSAFARTCVSVESCIIGLAPMRAA